MLLSRQGTDAQGSDAEVPREIRMPEHQSSMLLSSQGIEAKVPWELGIPEHQRRVACFSAVKGNLLCGSLSMLQHSIVKECFTVHKSSPGMQLIFKN